MVVNAKDKKKGKVFEKEGMREGDRLKQMDIWEDGLLMVLLIGGKLEIDVYDVVEIDKVKKKVTKYHWFEDILFFQDLIILKPAERRIIIENIYMKKLSILVNHKHLLRSRKDFSSMIELNLSRHLLIPAISANWPNDSTTWGLELKKWRAFQFVICFIELLLTLSNLYLRPLMVTNMWLLPLIIILNGVRHD